MTEKENSIEEQLTEEEFLELVLAEQQKALDEERERRLNGTAKTKKQRPTVKLFIFAMAFVLFFNTFAVIFQIYSIPAIEFIKVSTQLSKQENIQLYKKSVVEISTGESKGTGFSISDDGYIVTNEHVIDDALSLTVVFPEDGIYEAEVIVSDPTIDLAILKIQANNLPHLQLADTLNFKEQEHVYFIGNPLYFTGIANEGTLINYTQLSDWEKPVMMMQAPVYKGNSGSPVFTDDGEVIGIVFATMKDQKEGKVGLFVPVDYLHEQLAKIR
ncbi:serine protease [Solibacillus sp. CAU 1738]|uniref:S1C family serine protease n=1 Tax=Solibacillus sp. CAU 1738 TaxID=3140363 RepID=UPI0032604ECA